MGSVLRHICPVLAIAVAAGAMDIASAQQIGSASPDIRTGIYRGRSVTYEIIDGLAVWDGDIILGTPEELDIPGKALVSVNNNEMLWPGGIIPYVIDPETHQPACSQCDPALERKHGHPPGGKNESAELVPLRAGQHMRC